MTSLAEFVSALHALPSLELLFGKNTQRVVANGAVISGLSIFRQGFKPTWEALPDGGEYSWRGPMSTQQLVQFVSVISNWIATDAMHVADIIGIRLVNKNKQNLPLLKIELWCTSELQDQRRKDINSELAHHVKMGGLEQMQYTSHSSKKRHNKNR